MNILIAGEKEKTANYEAILNYLGYSCTVSLDPKIMKKCVFHRVILPGGGDIHPLFLPHNSSINSILFQNTEKTEPQVDLAQFLILDYSVKNKIPVLGICKGMQLINVYFGGTIFDNKVTTSHHIAPRKDVVHKTLVKQGSFLWNLYHKELTATKTLTVNSSHHQAIGTLGCNLTCIERCCKDNICEGFVHKNLPIIGLQWHPERMCHTMPNIHATDGTCIYDYFTSLAFHT